MKDKNKEHVKLHNKSIIHSMNISAYYVTDTALQLLRCNREES